MVVTYLLCAAILAVGSWKFYRSKRAYEEEISILKAHRDADKEVAARHVTEIETLKAELRDYRHLCGVNNQNLHIKQFVPFGNYEESCGSVIVARVDTRNPELWFPIKTFHYKVTDTEDYDFAMNEAEELIEKLKENCLPWND